MNGRPISVPLFILFLSCFVVAGGLRGEELPDDKVMKSDPYAATATNAFLGDRPGDVVAVSASFAGLPVTLPHGRVMLWSTANVSGTQWVAAVFSEDNGKSWSQPTNLFPFPQREKAQWSNGASLVDDKGYIHLFGLEYYQFDFKNRARSKSHLWHGRSRDGGKTWDEVQDVPFGYEYTGSSNGAFQSKRNRIFVPVSALSNRKIGVWVSVCPFSDDNGTTWKLPEQEIAINTGAVDWYESGAVEPVGIELNDGRLWLLPRSQDGFQWETFSQDHGKTWTRPRHSRFISNQSAMAILRLQDGRLLLLWNNCGAEGLKPVKWGNAERAVLAAAISDDEGKTWSGYREVARVTTSKSVGYPYVTQMRNGRLLLNASGFIATVDPAFLTRDTFSEDFTFGVRRWSTLASEGVSTTPNPDGDAGNVLKLANARSNVVAAACLNFPFGHKGSISVTFRVDPKFQGAHLTLSDHYDIPGLPRDGSFPIRINDKGRIELVGSGGSWLGTPGDVTPGKWHELKFTWDCPNQAALLELDGIEIGQLHQFVATEGLCYFRIRSLATKTDDAAMYIKSVRVSIKR